MIGPALALLLAARAASADGAAPPHTHAQEAPVKLSDSSVALAARVQAAKAYGDARSDPRALDALLAGLDARDESLHAAIVDALRRHQPEQVLVRRALDAKAAVPVRLAALAGLRALQPVDTAAQLVAGLDAQDDEVRAAVAHTFCVFGAAAAEARLIRAVAADPSKQVRAFAAVALGELKTTAAKEVVAQRLQTERELVVQDALEQAQLRQLRP